MCFRAAGSSGRRFAAYTALNTSRDLKRTQLCVHTRTRGYMSDGYLSVRTDRPIQQNCRSRRIFGQAHPSVLHHHKHSIVVYAVSGGIDRSTLVRWVRCCTSLNQWVRSEQGHWGTMLHRCGTRTVVAVCVVMESRRRAGKRVFRIRALAVRQKHRGQRLARQALLKVQLRIKSLTAHRSIARWTSKDVYGSAADPLVTALLSPDTIAPRHHR